MATRRAGLMVALALCACGELPVSPPIEARAQPILGGSADAGSTVNDVFLLAFTFNNAVNTVCTGTLIGPRTIVTAAHCVDPARQGATSVTIRATNKPTDVGLLSSDLIDVVDSRMHPSWTASATSATYDIALLLLQHAPVGITPRPFNRASLAGFAGQGVTLVGYGRTAAGLSDSGARRAATATISSVGTSTFDFGVAGSLGICSGDSGGASLHVFPDSVERLIGVHSLTSSAQCGVGSDTRIDFHLAFIDQWLTDKETVSDAGSVDAGPMDAGVAVIDSGVDAGRGDAGAPDAGAPDAGAPDAGAPDAGPRDAGAPDAGPPDAGARDAGARDAGLADASIVVGGGELGDPCVQGANQCDPTTVCAAPAGFETVCRVPCRADGGCPEASHCEAGVGGVEFCKGDMAVVKPPAEPTDVGDPVVGGCGSVPAPGGVLVVMVLLGLVRRRAVLKP